LSVNPGAIAQSAGLPVRGIVKAVQQASLSTDVPLRIMRLPFREGDRFEAGALLVEFDCRRQTAEMEAMKGALREAELNVSTSVSLDRYKAIGRNDVEIAQARLQKVTGELKSLEARVQDCTIKAPFSGSVAESALRELEFTVPQRPYLMIVGVANLEIEAIVSSSMIGSLSLGRAIRFKVDELEGTLAEATINSVGAVVDPVSKTLKIKASVKNPPARLVAGMSGTVIFLEAVR
jgi:RND family efflux transporter MFP subunit